MVEMWGSAESRRPAEHMVVSIPAAPHRHILASAKASGSWAKVWGQESLVLPLTLSLLSLSGFQPAL